MRIISIYVIFILILSFSTIGQTISDFKKKASVDIQSGNYEKAIITLNRALKIAPKDYSLLEIRAYCYENTNKIELALLDNLEVLKYDKSGDAHLRIGFDYMLLNKNREARDYLKKAVLLKPNEVQGLYNYGLTFQREEEYSEALKIYDELLKIDNNHIPTLISKSRCLLLLGELDKSKVIVDKFFEDNNFSPEMLMIRGEINQKNGLLEQALFDYSRAITLLPDDTDLLNRSASILSELGFQKEEEAIRKRIISLYKSNNEESEMLSLEYGLLAVAQMSSSSFKDAKESLDSAISLNVNKPNLYFYRCVTKVKLKDFEGACLDLKKANDLNPEKADENNEYFDDDIEFGEFQKICFSLP
jgi:tetratricopeptide (TPR) repeat protein